jgi:hypothetical protein
MVGSLIFGAGGGVWSFMALRRLHHVRSGAGTAARDEQIPDAFPERNPGLGLALGIVWLVIAVVAITGLLGRVLH